MFTPLRIVRLEGIAEQMVVDHMPELMVERVALAAHGAVAHVDVERAARQVGQVAPALPVILEVLTHDEPLDAHTVEEAFRVELVLGRERIARFPLRTLWPEHCFLIEEHWRKDCNL